MSDLISIVMPAKNAGKYIYACLLSIRNQTYSNWELLVVDDHSSDNTLNILKANAKVDARIHVFCNSGQGIIPALNLAYSKSKGSFITRMDADDIMPEKKLAHLFQALQEKGPESVATGFVEYFSDKELGNGFLKYAAWMNGLTMQNANFSEIYKECVIPSPCWMLHKEDLERIGAFRSKTYPEDYDLCFRMYKAGFQVAGVNEICHYWRDHSARASRNDANYADNSFLKIKIHYFLSIDYKSNKELVLWGAGRKGKELAHLLLDKGIAFRWICDNPKKIGKDIYGVVLESATTISNIENVQVIVAVANEEEQKKIRKDLSSKKAYWFA